MDGELRRICDQLVAAAVMSIVLKDGRDGDIKQGCNGIVVVG